MVSKVPQEYRWIWCIDCVGRWWFCYEYNVLKIVVEVWGIDFEPSSIIVDMAKKQMLKPFGVIDKVGVNVRVIWTLFSFQLLKEASYNLLLERPWLTPMRTTNWWHKTTWV